MAPERGARGEAEPAPEASRKPGARRRRSEGDYAHGPEGASASGSAAARSEKRPTGARGVDESPAVYRERVKQAALRLLSIRMRSRRELELRLRQRRFRAETIKDALDDFERVGLVDDGKFARLFLESRLRLRPRSYNALTRELRAKGLADELIKEVIDESRLEVTEEELARRILEQRFKGKRSVSSDQARASAARYLAGKGFAHSLIIEVTKDI